MAAISAIPALSMTYSTYHRLLPIENMPLIAVVSMASTWQHAGTCTSIDLHLVG